MPPARPLVVREPIHLQEHVRERYSSGRGRLWHTASSGFRVVVDSAEDGMIESLRLQLAMKEQELAVHHQEQIDVVLASHDAYSQAMASSQEDMRQARRHSLGEVGTLQGLHATPWPLRSADRNPALGIADQRSPHGAASAQDWLSGAAAKSQTAIAPVQVRTIAAVWADDWKRHSLAVPQGLPRSNCSAPNFNSTSSRRLRILEALQRTAKPRRRLLKSESTASVELHASDKLAGSPMRVEWHSKLSPASIQAHPKQVQRSHPADNQLAKQPVASKEEKVSKPRRDVRGLVPSRTEHLGRQQANSGPTFRLRRSFDLGKPSGDATEAPPDGKFAEGGAPPEQEPQAPLECELQQPQEPRNSQIAKLHDQTQEVPLLTGTSSVGPEGDMAGAVLGQQQEGTLEETDMYGHAHEVPTGSYEADDDATHVDHVLANKSDTIEQLRREASFLKSQAESRSPDGSRPSTASQANLVVKRKMNLLTMLEEKIAYYEAIANGAEPILRLVLTDSNGIESALERAEKAAGLNDLLQEITHDGNPGQDVAREDFDSFVSKFGLPEEHMRIQHAKTLLATSIDTISAAANCVVEEEVKQCSDEQLGTFVTRMRAVETFLTVMQVPSSNSSFACLVARREALQHRYSILQDAQVEEGGDT